MPSWDPHEYQARAIQTLLTQGSAGLFLDPGLGKTSTCLAAYSILKEKGFTEKMLIIAPLRPCYSVWPEEIRKWDDFSHLTYTILHGPKKNEKLHYQSDIYIINPEGLKWFFEKKGDELHKFDVLCVDESTKFKNTASKRFKMLKKKLNNFKRRWILTGTPVPNGIEDIFGQIYILDQGASLGRYITHFKNKYFYLENPFTYNWIIKPGAFEDVIERISPLILQLSNEEYLSMPDLIKTEVPVHLPDKAMKAYREVELEFMTQLLEGTLIASNAATAGTKCRQIANGAVYIESDDWVKMHDEKLKALEDLIEEISGAPVLVLYEYRHDLERIQEKLGPFPVLGGSSAKKTSEIIRGFNRGDIPIVMGHPASMGHGINLQESCHHVIWYGITWNLEYYDQAIARVYRQGQKKESVFVYHIVAKGTLDEKVLKVLQSKNRTQKSLLQALA